MNFQSQQYDYVLTSLLDNVENGKKYYKDTQAGKRALMHNVREMLNRADVYTSPGDNEKHLIIHGLKAMFPTTEDILKTVSINELLEVLNTACSIFYVYVMGGELNGENSK